MNQILQQVPTIQNPKRGFETIYFKEEKKLHPVFLKSIIFDILNLLIAFCLGYVSFLYLNNKTGIFPVLLFGILYFNIIIFNSALTKSIKRRLFIVFLESILFFVLWFFDIKNLNQILSLWLTFLVFRFWGEIKTHLEFKNNLKMKFLRLTSYNFYKSLIAIILAMTGFYIFNFNYNFLNKNWFENFWNTFGNIFYRFYPEININDSLSNFSYSLISYKLRFDVNFKNLLPDEQEVIIKSFISQSNEQILKLLGEKNVDYNKKFKDIVYDSLNNKINNLYNLYGVYFVIFWWLILFFIWFGIGYILKIFVTNFLNLIIFEILIYFDVIHINIETANKEVLNF